ncbi:hypothetical protein [Serratia liquefaciens]|uniref:hypothetical protein n=1 Tax=Serratia liquefaciens TaxID=614 RepID=UPI003B42DAE9
MDLIYTETAPRSRFLLNSYVKNTNTHSEIRSYREEGNKRAGKIFPLAAELAGVVMQSTLLEPANLNEKERQLYRLQYALDNQKDILAADKGYVAAAKRVVARREVAAIVATVGGGGLVLTAGGKTLVGAAPELVLAARLAIAGCKTNPALCLNQAGIFAADIVAPEAIIRTGAVTTGSTLILGKTEDSVRKLSR